MNFFIGKVLEVLYFPSNAVVKSENPREGFLRNFFFYFTLPVIENYDPEVSNYGRFICNIFGWDTVKIGIIRAKVQISMWI